MFQTFNGCGCQVKQLVDNDEDGGEFECMYEYFNANTDSTELYIVFDIADASQCGTDI